MIYMKIFVFDTETTGFINKKDTSLEAQPKIIQFAGILWELKNWKFTEEKRIDILINPKMPIPYNSSQVNHIYDIDVKNSPFIEDVIEEIMYYINTPDVIIWHNIEYDEDMLKIELRRLWLEYKYNPKQIKCTMKESVDFCQIEWNWNRYKYPKLWELHKKLFDKYFIWAHNAIVDVEATLACFVELVKSWVIEIEENKNDEIISLF